MNDPEAIAADAEAFRRAVRGGLPYRPLYVKLKLIWACNLRCAMCNHWREPSQTPMGTDRLLALIDELAGLGCRKIHISGGEPTLRPDLEVLIARMVEQGIRATMTTNATLIDERRARALTEAGLHKVNVSVDGPTAEVHDRVRGVPGAWERTVQGIRALRYWLTRPNSVRLNTVVNPLNYLSLRDLPDFARRLGIDRLQLIPVDAHTEEVETLTVPQIRRFNREVAPIFARKALAWKLICHRREAYPFGRDGGAVRAGERGHYARGYYDRHRCYAPWTHALVDHLGRVSVCCMTVNQPVMGDLRVQSFAEVWEGAMYTQLRSCSGRPALEACRHCDMFLAHNRRLEKLVRPMPWRWLPL